MGDSILKSLVLRFIVGVILVDLPILGAILAGPQPISWNALLVGLIGGAVTAGEKYLAPVLLPMVTDSDKIAGDATHGPVVAVPLGQVKPPPPEEKEPPAV